QQAWTALMGTSHPTSVVLNGTFTSTEGSRTQSGNAQLTVGSDGTYAVNLSRTVGPVSESRTFSNGVPTCTWTDENNVIHQISFVNCLSPAWFFPGLMLLSSNGDPSDPAWIPTSNSTDSLGQHLNFQFILPNLESGQEDPQLLKPLDLVLASGTLLPAYATFTMHPDNPAIHADIPVRIAYSNYQSVSGVMIPFHIQRYVNGSLVLDITVATASIQ
ncbi:MAG TPA: hypothetical protein VJ746_04795, partial [Nitrospira sp.]|nr:hypothetical protein [Nitrospira sp.]